MRGFEICIFMIVLKKIKNAQKKQEKKQQNLKHPTSRQASSAPMF